MVVSFVRAFGHIWQAPILGFTLLLPVLSALIWFGLALAIYMLFGASLEGALASISWLEGFRQLFEGVGLTLGGTVTVVILILLFAPLVYWTSLILLAVLALPWILRFLRPRYPQAFSNTSSMALLSTWRISAKIFLKATPAYGLLLVFAWVPGLFVVGNFILSAWVNAHFLAVEVLGEVTDEAEMSEIMNKHRTSLFLMGCGLMALLLVPVVQLITPVFGGLWFSHYLLAQVEHRRSQGRG